MRKADVEKGDVRGAYIGGGIFAILIALPLTFLFLPYFIYAITGFFIWDPGQLGINSSMLEYVLNFFCYFLPLILFLISFVCIFIARSKGSVFLKISTAFYFLYFVLYYTTNPLSIFIGTDINALIKSIPYINYIVIGLGTIFALLGIIFAGIQKGNPNRASSFLVFSSIFWLVMSVLDVVMPMIFSNNFSVIEYYLPTVLALYGLMGGIWMLIGCRKKIVILPEGERKVKKNAKVKNEQNNNDMANGGQQINLGGQQIPVGGMAQQNFNAVPQQFNGAMPQQGFNQQVMQHSQGNPNVMQNGMAPNGMPQRPMTNVAPQNGMQTMPNGMPQNGQRVMPNGMPQRPMPNAVPQNGMRPMPNGMPQNGQRVMPNGMSQRPMPNMAPQNGMRPMPNGMPQNGQRAMPNGMPQGQMPNGMPQNNVAQNNNINNSNNQNNNTNGGA